MRGTLLSTVHVYVTRYASTVKRGRVGVLQLYNGSRALGFVLDFVSETAAGR